MSRIQVPVSTLLPHPPVGFTGGQIHLIDPVHKELSRLYNEERLLDKTKVGEYSFCIRTLEY
jgi:hypothetical protein